MPSYRTTGRRTVGDDAGVPHGYLLTAGRFATFYVPGAGATYADNINADGRIVGTYDDHAKHSHGFLMIGGRFTTFDVSGATSTLAYGINRAGQIVGYYEQNRILHGFLFAGGQFTTIDVPGAAATWAWGINATGQIVGYYQDTAKSIHGFVRDASGHVTTIDAPELKRRTFSASTTRAGSSEPTSAKERTMAGRCCCPAM